MIPSSVAILAVGTELTDGQILNRNSQWISSHMTELGYRVLAHEVVPDHRDWIRDSLERLSALSTELFVTGGLGPTSDDFTRQVLSEWLGVNLVWHESSWQHIVQRLGRFQIAVAESNRQQCFYPEGARILVNHQGTANGFQIQKGVCRIWVLPGPPREIESIWQQGIDIEIRKSAPKSLNRKLLSWKCIGLSEAKLGEVVEEALKDSGWEIGYRAHMPYVEIKVWVKEGEQKHQKEFVDRLEQAIQPWIVSRGDEDAAIDFVKKWKNTKTVLIRDAGTFGYLSDRLGMLKMQDPDLFEGFKCSVQTFYQAKSVEELLRESSSSQVVFAVSGVSNEGKWQIGRQEAGKIKIEELKSPWKSSDLIERNRKLVGELALHHWV